MKERVSITPRILELNDTNDIYMTMNIVILSENINYNNAQFTHDFIDGVVENKEDYLGIPFLVNREKLENGEFDNLTHELDLESGELKTDQIGSFIDFWEDEVDGTKCLLGAIRIFKRFTETCSKIIELVKENQLETSCEVLISEFKEISEDGVRVIHYNDGGNALIGSALVSDAAEPLAKPTMLIAEAYQKDIKSHLKGGDKLSNKKTKDKIETMNKGVEVKFHGNLETSNMTWDDVYQKIYNTLNPVDTENGGRNYEYYMIEVYTDSVIVSDWNNNQLYRITYAINSDDNTVTLAPKEDWVKGSFQFVPEGVAVNELISQNEQKINSLKEELSELKEEKKEMSKDNKVTMEELQEKVETLETEISNLQEENKKLEETIVSQKEESLKSEEKVKELNGTVEELTKYREQVEKAEKEAKEKELNEKYSKLLSEETFKSEEVQNAISELDETVLNSIVVSEIAKVKADEVSNKKEDIEIAATKQDDLIEPTILQKYGLD